MYIMSCCCTPELTEVLMLFVKQTEGFTRDVLRQFFFPFFEAFILLYIYDFIYIFILFFSYIFFGIVYF